MKSYTPYQKSVRRYVSQSLDKLFGTTEFAKSTRKVMGKKTTGVSEFTGKSTGLVEGDSFTFWQGKASSIRGVYVLCAINAADNTGHKTVEVSVSPPSDGQPWPGGQPVNDLGKSFSGGTASAKLDASYDEPTDTIRVYIENIVTTNPKKVYDYSYKVTVFYK